MCVFGGADISITYSLVMLSTLLCKCGLVHILIKQLRRITWTYNASPKFIHSFSSGRSFHCRLTRVATSMAVEGRQCWSGKQCSALKAYVGLAASLIDRFVWLQVACLTTHAIHVFSQELGPPQSPESVEAKSSDPTLSFFPHITWRRCGFGPCTELKCLSLWSLSRGFSFP